MANMIFVLVQQILMVIMNFFGIIGNGLILYIIFSSKALRKNQSLYLITALACVDFIFALTVYPYLIFLLSGWSMEVNYSALPVLCLVMPVVSILKFCQMLDIAIAVDRLTAIQWPIAYKLRNRARYTALTLTLGLCFAAFDVTFIWVTTEVQSHPGCAGGGCFMSDIYLNYSGYADMCIDSIGLIITSLLLISVLAFKRRSNATSNLDETFKRANRTAVSVLLCSSITLLLPGVLQSAGSTFGFGAIQKFGPTVAFGLVLNAAANPIIYGYGHKDIYQALKKLLNTNAIVQDVPPLSNNTTAQL